MISAAGIGSGLDINSIVSQLISAEGDNKTLILADKISVAEAEISAFGSLKSSLESFQNSIDQLKDKDTFNARRVSASDEEVFSVSGIGDLAVASYEIEVLEFAEAHKIISTGFADQEATIGTGQITFSSGAGAFTVDITSENNTLAGIRDTINEAADNTGITASIANVDDGSGGTESKLIISANDTGTDNAVSITVVDDDANNTDNLGLSVFYYDTGDATTPEQMTELTTAVDAQILIDGQTVTSSKNEIVNALEGITINLLKEDPGNKHTLKVSLDDGAVENSINTFLANFNALTGVMNALTNVNESSEEVGLLIGDRTLLTLSGQLRREMSTSINVEDSLIQNLVQLGITTSANGALEIDSSKLKEVLDSDLDNIKELFTSTNGIATRLDAIINDYVKSGGIIDSKTKGLNSTIDRASDDLAKLDASLARMEERLLSQFSSMDLILSQLNATSSFLETQLSALTTSLSQRNRR